MDILIIYSANYNGCCVYDSEGKEVEGGEECASDVIEYAFDFCDDDGEFDGDEKALVEFMEKTVREHFPNVGIVTTEIDTCST